MSLTKWFANGKLLLTGEYLVLHGAKALALPITMGQSLTIHQGETDALEWRALKPDGLWFSATISLPDFTLVDTDNPKLGEHLLSLLKGIVTLKPSALDTLSGTRVETTLDFNPEYGFGSSSTLICNLASWVNVDPYELLAKTFGGSGYDIACGYAEGPLLYSLKDGLPIVEQAGFRPSFADNLFFAYLGRKQQSSRAIQDFNRTSSFDHKTINRISQISKALIGLEDLQEFQHLLNEHEQMMSAVLHKATVKSICFPDLDGAVKSLGAWGGDFVLITSQWQPQDLKEYLFSLGYKVIYPYRELVL